MIHVEPVDPGWRPCWCAHPERAHDEAQGMRCTTAGCLCSAYQPAPSAPEALAGEEYEMAWEVV